MLASSHPSSAIQALIEKGVFDRLPLTFSTYCFDQIKEWELLFEAERAYFERLFGLLGRSQQSLVDELFAPLRAVEQKMGVTEKVFPKRVFTLDQVDFLNRSQHYPEWRRGVTDIFSKNSIRCWMRRSFALVVPGWSLSHARLNCPLGQTACGCDSRSRAK